MKTQTPPSETVKVTTGITINKQPKPTDMSKSIFDKFTKQYSLSKTLRFELVPTEDTKQIIKKNGTDKNLLQYFLEKDKELARDYEIIKHVIDEYHKYFIEKALIGRNGTKSEENEEEDDSISKKIDEKSFSLSEGDLEKFEDLFVKDSKDEGDDEKIKKLKAGLRNQVSGQFKKQPEYNKLDSKELLKAESLLDIAEADEKLEKLNKDDLTEEKLDAIFSLEEIKNALDEWAGKQKKEKNENDKKNELKKRLLNEIKIRDFNAELKELVIQEFEQIKEDDWEKELNNILINEKVKTKIGEHPKKTGKPKKKLQEALFGLPGIIPVWLSGDGIKEKVLENLKEVIEKEYNENSKEEIEKALNKAIKTFQSGFFTYLKSFCENRRENIYTDEFKSTGIAKRIIDDNLPKFLFNKKIFENEKYKSFFQKSEQQLIEQLNTELKINSLSDFFILHGFNKVLIQNDHKLPRESGIDAYNLLISGKKPEKDKSIKGLNQLINEHNQTAEKENKIPKLKKLFKLPLCDSESASFSFAPFENDKEALIAVKNFYEKIICKNEKLKENSDSQPVDVSKHLKSALDNVTSSEKIFIKRAMLSSISSRIFDKEGIENKWNIINQALEEYFRDEKIEGSPGKKLLKINNELKEKESKKPPKAKKGVPKQDETDELKKLKKEITQLKNQKKKFEEYLTAENGMSKWLRTNKHFSIKSIEDALKRYKQTGGLDEKIKNRIRNTPVCDYFKTLGKLNGENKNLFEKIKMEFENVNELLNRTEQMKREDRLKSDDKAKLKSFLECFNKKFENKNEDELSLLQFIKPLVIGEDVEDFDKDFYDGYKIEDGTKQFGFTELYEQLASGNDELPGIVPLYNKVRSRFQKKDYSTDAVRLCFDKGTLANGWVESNEATQFYTYLLRKENKNYNQKYNITNESKKEYDYFLGISHDTKLFGCDWYLKQDEQTADNWSEYQRLNYYQLNPQTENSSLKKFLIEFAKNDTLLSKKIEYHFKEINTNASTCVRAFSNELQKHFKNISDDNQFNLNNYEIAKDKPKEKLYANKKYSSFQDLFNDIQKKEFRYYPVNKAEFEYALQGKKIKKGGLTESHPLLLFKITNKDLSYAETHLAGKRNCDENGNERKRREEFKENLHTIYFRHLMSGNQNAIDLGTGMLFFRQASPNLQKNPKKPHHSEGKYRFFESKRWQLTKEGEQFNKFDYDLYKNKRFTYENDKSEGKYFLHLSTQINYLTGVGSDKVDINKNVLEWLKKKKENDDFRIIGIDRGERHLLYFSIIDRHGVIKDQFTLNEPELKANNFKTDYKKLLEKASDKKKENQRNWDEAIVIDGLKKGYLSHVVHRLCNEILKDGKPNAIVVMEHLNRGFMQQRPIDNSVYAKFEEMLVKKLNWLTTKDTKVKPTDAGGVLNGWQLTEEYSVRNIDSKKQNGIIFYAPAKYTSKIDPVSGFVNFFSYSKLPFDSATRAKDFFGRFTSIRFENDCFEFEFNYDEFKKGKENEKSEKLNSEKNKKDSGYLYLTNDVAGEMKWTVRTNDSLRYNWDRKENEGRGGQKPINVFAYDEAVKKDAALKTTLDGIAGNINEQMKYLLKEIGKVDLEKGDIKEQLLQNDQLIADFFKKLLKLFFSVVTLRQNNGKTGAEEEDFINSLVVKKGREEVKDSGKTKPENADANGAYNIALKGKWYLDRIEEFELIREEAKKNKKGFPSTEKWMQCAQGKPY